MLTTFMALLKAFVTDSAPAWGGSIDGLNAMSTDSYSSEG